jgi:hypothetical protein
VQRTTRTHEGARVALANWRNPTHDRADREVRRAADEPGQTGAAERPGPAYPGSTASARLQIVLALERTNRLADAPRARCAAVVANAAGGADAPSKRQAGQREVI